MSIEKEIHQQSFTSSKQKALINLLYTYNWVMERIKAVLAKEDITPQQFNILRILRGSHPDPLSTLQIRERMLDRMSDTSRIVDRLVTKGLVKKVACNNDKRLVDVTIADKGQRLLKRIDMQSDYVSEIMNAITDKEAAQLSSLLDKVRNDL